jgi:hypothetical protein
MPHRQNPSDSKKVITVIAVAVVKTVRNCPINCPSFWNLLTLEFRVPLKMATTRQVLSFVHKQKQLRPPYTEPQTRNNMHGNSTILT